jgi:protein-tyrosine phosphatase
LQELADVDDVFWIEGNPPAALAIVLCPRGDAVLRDDLRQIRKGGVETLVSMLEPTEARWLGLGKEGEFVEAAGMRFLSYPIRDTHVPADIATFRTFVKGLADRLRAGERIGMHCRGSIGRAPLTAACTLIHLGWKANDALEAIRAARGYRVPDTEEQLRWILNYKAEP